MNVALIEKSSQLAKIARKTSARIVPVPSVEDRRLADVERSVYITGFKTLQKQERISTVLTVLLSLSILSMLFYIIKFI